MGPAHNVCNSARRRDVKLPIMVHNLASYDGHILLEGLRQKKEFLEHFRDQQTRELRISAIPANTEKLRTLTMGVLCFMDSYQFQSSSLAKLADSLVASNHSFPLLDRLLAPNDLTTEQKQLLLGKACFCYTWFDDIEKMRAATEFPPRDVFFNDLTQQHVSEEEYERGRRVFEVFECADMMDYTELYCRLDTFLLAEIMLQFRDEIFDEFGLCAFYYISSPHLAFDLMLKVTGVNIDLMSDPEMVKLMMDNIRGGLSFASERLCHSDPELPGYDPKVSVLDLDIGEQGFFL